jgi:hypothetical protein
MSWGSADLVPTSRPLRSEWALGSVVPLPPVLLPDSGSQYHPRFTESRGGAEQSVPRLGGTKQVNPSGSLIRWP